MASKIDILAPATKDGESVLVFSRWLKLVGENMLANEPIAELNGSQMVVYVHAPAEGVLSSMLVQPGQNVLSGALLGQLSVIAKNEIEWDNFDEVTTILEDLADKSTSGKPLKDASDALGQLLGVADKPVFQNMSIEQQNKFLQNVVDHYKGFGLSAADMAQQLLAGLQLRPPVNVPGTPTPVYGIRPMGPAGPTPGGMGGGMGGGGVHYAPGVMPQQQQGYAPYSPSQVQGQWPSVPRQPGQIGQQGGQALPPPFVPPAEDETN